MNTPKFSFGMTPQATTTTSGGLFGSQQPSTTGAQPTSLFGGFGQASPAASTTTTTGTTFGGGFMNKPATGSLFGQSTPTASTFNKPAATTGSPFSFGQTTTAATTASPAPAATSGFGGFGGFGTTTTTATQPATQQPSFGGFGTQQTTTTAPTSLFGFSQPQQQQQQQPQQTQQSSFFSLSQPVQQTQQSALGASMLNQTTAAASQPTAAGAQVDHLMNALVHAQVYNDERDLILAKWNQLQAFYGTGKIFYQNMAIDVTKDNRLSRFKTIGYSCRPTHKSEDGLVCLIVNQKETNVKANQKSIVDCLHKVFNSDPGLTVNIDSIKPLADEKTEVIFYVEQRVSPVTDQKTRVSSVLVFNHLNKQEAPAPFLGGLKTGSSVKQQLEQINVVNMYPLVGLTDEQIKSYLDNPPAGLNPLLWDQAKKSNPNPKKLLPVQISGFQEINKRFKLQDQENQAQSLSLTLINNKIEGLNSRNKLIKSKIEQFKARNDDLEQRLLKVMINYEIRRKVGVPLQDNERYLYGVLESFQIELSSPMNKEIMRQKFNEFMEIIKTFEAASNSRQQHESSDSSAAALGDISNVNNVHKSLREQQKAFKSLIEIITQDMKDINLIKKGLFYEK